MYYVFKFERYVLCIFGGFKIWEVCIMYL